MRLAWPVVGSGTEVANMIGYTQTSAQLRQALRRLGVTIDEGRGASTAKLAVHYQFPLNFRPVKNKVNALFTMFENYDEVMLSNVFAPAFAQCDFVLTPSRWCKDLFETYTDKPIFVANLGVDEHLFPYKRRRWHPERGEPFIWCYFGAPNRRKYTSLDRFWENIVVPLGGRHWLYVKTTGGTLARAWGRWIGEGMHPLVEEDEYGQVFHGPMATIDNRRLPYEKMVEVYYKAHAMLFLTSGEGWGMTGLEAMCSGLPLIVSDATGVQEYVNDGNAFLVPAPIKDVEMAVLDGLVAVPEEEKRTIRCHWPDDHVILDRVGEVAGDYRRATKIAARAAEEARRFTWDRSARRVLEVLKAWV